MAIFAIFTNDENVSVHHSMRFEGLDDLVTSVEGLHGNIE